jgi:hypothetical protein
VSLGLRQMFINVRLLHSHDLYIFQILTFPNSQPGIPQRLLLALFLYKLTLVSLDNIQSLPLPSFQVM